MLAGQKEPSIYYGRCHPALIFSHSIRKGLLPLYPIPWYNVLLISIPELFLVITLGFALFDIKISPKQVLLIASLASGLVYLIRLVNTINGVQALLGIIITIVLSFIITRKPFWKISAAIISGSTIAAVLQSIYAPIFFSLTKTTIHSLSTSPRLNLYFFIPEAAAMLVFCILIFNYRLRHQDTIGRL